MRLEPLSVACLLHHYQVVRLAWLGTDPENLPILAAEFAGVVFYPSPHAPHLDRRSWRKLICTSSIGQC
jgi:hypothetical protein